MMHHHRSQYGQQPFSGPRRPAGTVLIVTMWLVLVLAGMVLVLARTMRVEAGASANVVAAQQAHAIEQGAIQYILTCVDELEGRMPLEDEMPCEGVQVGDGAFWIVRADPADDRQCRYGLVDEAAKLNVNAATIEALAALPEMTDEMAASLVDWRDGDSEPTPEGVESEHYLLLPAPHECKNAPLETVEELLLINGWSSDDLFGEDANHNDMLDDNENDADDAEPDDDGNGELDRGLDDFVTVYSAEPNTSASGEKRVNVNQADTFVASSPLTKVLSGDRLAEVHYLYMTGRPFASTLDFYYRTGLTTDEFKALEDLITTSNGRAMRGLINVNTAPKEVLATLPGLEDEDVLALTSARPAGEYSNSTSIAWVIDALPKEKVTAIGPHITGRSFQFSANIVSVSGNGRAIRRCRVVVDAAASPPRVLYRQDLTALGWPLPEEIIDELRSGRPMEEVIDMFSGEVR